MAINYNAGFLPQELYSNISNIMQQGIDQQAQRREDRWNKMRGISSAIAGSANKKSAEAKAAYKADYESQKARLQERMKEVDPRDVMTMKKFDEALGQLDKQYNAGLKQFEDSGFLGSVLGKDYENLALQQMGMPDVNPAMTRRAYDVVDENAKDLNRKTVESLFAGDIAENTARGTNRAATATALDEDAQKAREVLRKEELQQYTDKKGVDTNAWLDQRGGTDLYVEDQLQQQRIAADDARYARDQAGRAAELAQRLGFQRDIHGMTMAEWEKKAQYAQQQQDAEMALLEKRLGITGQPKAPSLQDILDVHEKASGIVLEKLAPGMNEDQRMMWLEKPQNREAYNRALAAFKEQLLGGGRSPMERQGPQQDMPSKGDFFGRSQRELSGSGVGFLTPEAQKSYQVQIDYLLQGVEALPKGKHPELRKKVDRLQTDIMNLNQMMSTSNDPAQREAIEQRRKNLAQQIGAANKEIYEIQKAEYDRKVEQRKQREAAEARRNNVYVPDGQIPFGA